ncbi:MAG: glycosyltransferase family 2 protein, partial [Clostridia bacterium]
MIRLSIIIPVYNVQDYLPQCMESVLRQIGDDQEVVLVDDGSTDTCPQICDQYVAEHDCVRVVHQSNQGLSSARNMGMRHANGEYLLFLDSDDILLPEAIKRIEVALEQCVNADAIMFSYAELDVDGKVGPTKGLIPQLRNGLYTAESE